MEQNTKPEPPDYKNLLDRIYDSMGGEGRKKAIVKFGKGAENLQHTWEAYHFIGFVEEMFEVNYRELMNDFNLLLIDLKIGAYGEDFRKLPSAKGFTSVRAKALFKGVLNIRNSTLDIQPPTLRHPNDGTAGKLMPFAADSAATSVILGRRAVWGR